MDVWSILARTASGTGMRPVSISRPRARSKSLTNSSNSSGGGGPLAPPPAPLRARPGTEAILIGPTTHPGTATAARDWGAPAERKRVRPGLPGSVEALFHETDIPRFALLLRGEDGATVLRERRIERAIGVIYRP